MRRVAHIYLSNSSLSEYKSCGRLFALKRLMGLAPTAQQDLTADPAYRGNLIHTAIDAAYSGGDPQAALRAVPEGALRDIPSKASGSISHIDSIIQAYLDRYTVPNDPDFEVLRTECELHLPLKDWLTFVGRVDKIGRKRSTGEIVVIDHKTSSSISRWIEPQVALSDQFTGYIAAANANGWTTSTCIVDAISTALKALQTNEGLFARFETTRSVEQIQDWKDRFIKDASRLKDDIESGCFTTGQPKTCVEFSGCEFRMFCESPTTAVGSAVLRNAFSACTRPWDCDKIIYESEATK